MLDSPGIPLSVVLSCVYTIYPTDQVLLTELGAPKAVISDPGLHFKIPFLQYANFMSRQLLSLETPSEEVIAQDKKRLVVDAFARWRIVDPLRYYQSVPYANQEAAEGLLIPILSSNIRRVLGSQNFAAMLDSTAGQHPTRAQPQRIGPGDRIGRYPDRHMHIRAVQAPLQRAVIGHNGRLWLGGRRGAVHHLRDVRFWLSTVVHAR